MTEDMIILSSMGVAVVSIILAVFLGGRVEGRAASEARKKLVDFIDYYIEEMRLEEFRKRRGEGCAEGYADSQNRLGRNERPNPNWRKP